MLRFTCIVVVRNEVRRLPKVVDSIRRQSYDPALVQILVVDGLSTDGTQECAKSLGCDVIANEMVRAEPGVALGHKYAKGDVVVTLAADNVLSGTNFFSDLAKPFADRNVCAAMPLVISTAEDDAMIAYVNRFSDPFNHFLYWDAVSPWTFAHYYPRKYENESFVVYNFLGRDMPMLALAQGMAVRAGFERDPRLDEDDMAPVTDAILRGLDVACMKSVHVEHHSATNGKAFIEKFRPRFRDRLISRNRPVWNRAPLWSRAQRIRALCWPFYGVSYLLPLMVGLFRYLRDRDAAWLSHASFCFSFCMMMWDVAVRELLAGTIFRFADRPFPTPPQ